MSSFGVSLSLGDRLSLTVEDIAFGGEGVARAQGFVVFVGFAAPGEVVEVEVTELRKRFARAKLLRVVRRSPHRVEPICPLFGQCGGCQYQHLAYPVQLLLKHKQIANLFERVGRLDPGLIAPVIPCPKPHGYRNRIMVRSQWDKPNQRLNLGFIRADSRLVVDLEECKIAEPALNDQIKYVRAHPPPRGGIKVVLRIPPVGWEVPPDSFFQNNSFLLPTMVHVVRELLRKSGARHLLDIFCGVGFFSIELGDLVESFIGLELDRLAVRAAHRNAIAHRLTNGEFVTGAAEDVLPALLVRFAAQTTTVLLDPPRKGCQAEMLQVLRQVRPAQVVYVSCHPATMARDLNVLCAGGVFEVAQVVPLDMFPNTQHVECVADVRSR
ncbi:MAG TPA: class I SAM-dependent RNA methyltransferase [Verrucomicrobiota bacterium]|nr:class I SAM-dependent RNA methyltransferase [Verrucomicrobiota bacterium]